MHADAMPNARIFASDGKALGTVKEVRGAYYKVDAPMKPDYWLHCDTVRTNLGDSLTTSFPAARLADYKQPEPEAAMTGAGTGRSGMAATSNTTGEGPP
jgi:hypothetical protein